MVRPGNRPSSSAPHEQVGCARGGTVDGFVRALNRVQGLGSQPLLITSAGWIQVYKTCVAHKSAAKCVAQTGASVQGFNTATSALLDHYLIRKVVSSLILAIWFVKYKHVRLCELQMYCVRQTILFKRFASGPSASGFLFKHPSLDE
jgi:hypothetical protein